MIMIIKLVLLLVSYFSAIVSAGLSVYYIRY